MDIRISRLNAASHRPLGLLCRSGDGPAGGPVWGIGQAQVDELRTALIALGGSPSEAERDAQLATIAAAAADLIPPGLPQDNPQQPGWDMLVPDGNADEQYNLWREFEHLAFEVAGAAGGDPTQRRCAMGRALGTAAPAPVRPGESTLKVLVISASPDDQRLERAAQQVEAIRQLWRGVEDVELTVIDGKDTWGSIARLTSDYHRAPWDVVHILAHGRRNTKKICLVTSDGAVDLKDYGLFADHLSNKLADVRLVTLAVCASSPLAVELANRFPGARVVGLLGDMRVSSLEAFYKQFYRHLWPANTADPGLPDDVSAEDSFAFAKAALRMDSNPEWYLPVLYAPIRRLPLLRLDIVKAKAAILALARSERFDEAEARARGREGEDGRFGLWATRARNEIRALRNYRDNLRNCSDEMAQAAGPGGDWAGFGAIHARWHNAAWDSPQTAGALAQLDPNQKPLSLVFLEETRVAYERIKTTALEAARLLGELAFAESGRWCRLSVGCLKLADVLRARDPQDAKAAAVFLRGAKADVEAIDVVLAHALVAPQGWDAQRQRLIGVLDRIAAATDALKATPADLLAKKAADGLRGRLKAILAQVAAAVPAPAPALAAELLQAGGRADLLRHLSAPPPPAAPAAVPPDLESLRAQFQGPDDSGAPIVAAAALRACQFTALANPAAPIRLVVSLAESLHPYLVLGGYGGTYDSSATVWRSIETTLTGEGDTPSRAQGLIAIGVLTQDADRLCLDATMLPMHGGAELVAWQDRVMRATLHGEPPPDAPASLRGIDRAVALAFAGRTAAAATAAFGLVGRTGEDPGAGAAARTRPPFDEVRTAFLLGLHDIACTLADAAAFDTAAMTARWLDTIGVLGILDSDPALGGWIRRRLGVYGSVQPASVDALLRSVRAHLRRQFDDLLARLEARRDQAGLVTLVREEVAVELRAAGIVGSLAGSAADAAELAGGYHGARLQHILPLIGERLRFVQRRLCEMTDAEYYNWVAHDRATKEQFHDLATAFSSLRRALLAWGEVQALRKRLPIGAGMAAGDVAEVADLLADPLACPMYATLEEEEAAILLSAQIAWTVANGGLRHLREQLVAGTVQQAGPTLRIIMQMQNYLQALRYSVLGQPMLFGPEIDDICVGWARGILERYGALDMAALTAEEKGRWRTEFARATQAADDMHRSRQNANIPGAEFERARAKLHLACGVFLAKAFQDHAGAFAHTAKGYLKDDGPGLLQYLIATKLHARQTAGAAVGPEGLAEAIRLIEAAIDEAERFRQTATVEQSDIAEEIGHLRALRESLQTVNWAKRQ